MRTPFTKKTTLRDKLEAQLSDLGAHTDELRKQVVERVPAVRDLVLEQTDELRKQVADRAPVVREQIVAALPDKEQLLDLRDDLFERLPENVQDRLPETVKPKRTRLRKVAALGVLTGAGAAAFAIVKRRGGSTQPAAPSPVTPPPAPASAPATPSASPTSPLEQTGPDGGAHAAS
jgi:hypothetical protein